MSIQEKINNEIKLSMKEKNVDKLAALRSVKSAILLELTKDGKTNMSEDEIEEYIRTKLNEMDNVSLKDMGSLMGLLMKELSGKADGKIISKILKRKLSEKD